MNVATVTTAAPLATWSELLHRLLRSTGGEAGALRASLAGLAAAAAVQGLALACVFPMLAALLGGANRAPDGAAASRWLLAFAALALITSALRWRAQGFDFHGHMARATHALRTRLGEQLRRMPLEATDIIDLWLDPRMTEPEELKPILQQLPSEHMQSWAVGKAVGNVRNQGPELMEPIGPPEPLDFPHAQ